MSELQTTDQLPELFSGGYYILKDKYANDNYYTSRLLTRVIKVQDLEENKYREVEYNILNPHTLEIFTEVTRFASGGKEEKTVFTKSKEEFHDYYTPIELEDYLEAQQIAEQMDKGTFNISQFKQEEAEESFALMGKKDKAFVQNQMEVAKKMSLKFKAAQNLLYNKHAAMIRSMERKKEELMNIKKGFEKQIKKLFRVITIIELYLGIDEEITVLQEGEKASADEPLSIRQLVLYMDEESALEYYDRQGLDYRDVHAFDEWILENRRWEKFLPEQKGIVVFKPRRGKKDYGDPWLNMRHNFYNLNDVYIFCRNGENLYRIFTEKVSTGRVFFPKKDEFSALYEKMAKESDYYKEKTQDEIDDKLYSLQRRLFLVQGLIDRANLFDLQDKLNVSKPVDGQLLNLIYDAEGVLSQGQETFSQWKERTDKLIHEGSRIFLMPVGYIKREDAAFHWFNYDSYSGFIPDTPDSGVYTVQKFEGRAKYDNEKKTYDTIMYLPNSEVISGWGSESKERQNKVRWNLYYSKHINYDQLNLELVEFFLNDRVNRPNYLEFMDSLVQIRQELLRECESEKSFAEGAEIQLLRLNIIRSEFIPFMVKELIQWWKVKNKWKRYLSSDDEKAWRMIEKEAIRLSKFNVDKLFKKPLPFDKGERVYIQYHMAGTQYSGAFINDWTYVSGEDTVYEILTDFGIIFRKTKNELYHLSHFFTFR